MPDDLIASYVVAGTPGGCPQLAGPVDPVVVFSERPQRRPDHRVAAVLARRACAPCSRSTCSGPRAHLLSTARCTWARPRSRRGCVDEVDYFSCWRSSSAPKKLAARFRISLARFSSRISCSRSSDPLRLRGRHPGRVPVVDVGLAHPGPHRLDAVAELTGDPLHRPVLSAQLCAQGPHHPHRGGLLFRAVPTRRRLPWRLFLRHPSILVSKFVACVAPLGQLGLQTTRRGFWMRRWTRAAFWDIIRTFRKQFHFVRIRW